jgi:lysophospholipase L1-like esterase
MLEGDAVRGLTTRMETDMTGRIPARAAKLGAAMLAATAALAMTAGAAGASEVVYNNMPGTLPGNLPSIPFEAIQNSEFGGQVEFAGTARTSPTVTVTMSSWACGNLKSGAACATTGGATFEWPITLNVYDVLGNNEPGTKIASVTNTFKIPYRPTPSKKCAETGEGKGWGKECLLGKLHKITFKLPGVTLPAKAIISVAYNTTDYGYAPTPALEVGEDSLNVAVTETPSATPSVGTDPVPADGYLNSITSSWYGGLGTVGTFSLAGPTGYLEGYQPILKVTSKLTPTAYVAIGDSLGFGYKEMTFNENQVKNAVACGKGEMAACEPISSFEGGYVGNFAKKLAAVESRAHNALTTFNLGCPGETTGGMIGNGALGTGLEELRAYEDKSALHVAAPCGYQNVDGFPLKTELGGASELENAVGLLKAGVDIKAVTINMGSNDELETVGKCESPAYDAEQGFTSLNECIGVEASEAGHEYAGGLFTHIITNIGVAIGTLRSYGYTGPVVLLGFYNPQALQLPGSDTLQKALNGAVEGTIAAQTAAKNGEPFEGVKYANPFPVFNPADGTNEIKEEKAICKYTEECNAADIAYNKAHGQGKVGDIHPTAKGYETLGKLVDEAF